MVLGVVDLGDLACVGDLEAPISVLAFDEVDDEDEDVDFFDLSIASNGLTADESAPICEQVCANNASGLFLASIVVGIGDK